MCPKVDISDSHKSPLYIVCVDLTKFSEESPWTGGGYRHAVVWQQVP